MAIWFTADTHFGHARIIRETQRPFADVDAMDAEMIRRWNDRVAPEDTVYHLGDFALGPSRRQREVLGQLNGAKKILLVGNHDYNPERLVEWGFESHHYDLVVHIDTTPVYLRHEPPPLEVIPRPCIFCLHGHTHRQPSRHPLLNVGVDRFAFRPVGSDEIARLLEF